MDENLDQLKEKIKEIAKKWAFHLRESAISEESAIEEAIAEVLEAKKQQKQFKAINEASQTGGIKYHLQSDY